MNTTVQLGRYAIVGLVSNGLLYAGYLFLTYVGIGHKTAMTALYIVGILQTFLFNRSWTFEHDDVVLSALIPYAVVYALGYLLNFGALWLFVDKLLLPHQVIQGVTIILVAIFIFVAQKYWVFSARRTAAGVELSR